MKYLISLSFIIVLFSCKSEHKTNQKLQSEAPVEIINGYFLKNNVELKNATENFVITGKKDFDSYLGVAKTMKNEIPEVNFEENNVLIIATKSSEQKKDISILSSEVKNNELSINYKILSGNPQSFSSKAVKVLKISKDIEKVKFKAEENGKENEELITI